MVNLKNTMSSVIKCINDNCEHNYNSKEYTKFTNDLENNNKKCLKHKNVKEQIVCLHKEYTKSKLKKYRLKMEKCKKKLCKKEYIENHIYINKLVLILKKKIQHRHKCIRELILKKGNDANFDLDKFYNKNKSKFYNKDQFIHMSSFTSKQLMLFEKKTLKDIKKLNRELVKLNEQHAKIKKKKNKKSTTTI